MVTYLLVALLGLGTLIAYGLSMQLVKAEAQVSNQVWPEMYVNGDFSGDWDENNYTCEPRTYVQETFATERITWLLAANPFVVVADAAPHSPDMQDPSMSTSAGPMGTISDGVRYSQAGAEFQLPCLNGIKNTQTPPIPAPLWPLGLGIQVLLAGGLVAAGRNRLRTPAGRVASGTRIA